MPKTDGLTEKQKIFCREYIYDWNATRAAKVAGYSEHTAGAMGFENLQKPEIQAEVKRLQGETAQLAGISRLMLAEELKKMALSSIAHLHLTWITRKEFDQLTEDQKACIAEIQTQTRIEMKYNPTSEEEEPVQVDFVKIKLYDKLRAIDSLKKMFGYDEPDEVKHTLPTGQTFIIGGQKIEF